MDDETREILTSRAYEALAAVDRAGRMILGGESGEVGP